MSIQMLAAWILPVSVISYLIALVRFVSIIRNTYAEYWESLGNPDLSGANGQVAILKIIFFPKQLPEEIAASYKNHLYTVRILAFLSLALFALVLLMVYTGMYENL